MTADSRSPAAPIAIRITRPYASEDEYLENELDTLTRASITLVGAQPRAEGVVLRFEVALPSGQVLIRGEGRVVGFKASAHQGLGGLTLRFTRLDTRSKTLIDKAAALRERRRPSLRPPTGETAAARTSVPPPLRHSATPPPLPVQNLAAPLPMQSLAPPLPTPGSAPPPARSVTPPPFRGATPSRPPPAPTGVASQTPSRPPPPYVFRSAPPPLHVADPTVRSPSSRPPPPPNDPPPSPAAYVAPRAPAVERPAFQPLAPRDVDRDSALQRLRARARALDPAVVAHIVGARER